MEYNDNKKYTLYMHICPNDKKYIGITCQDPKHRWSNGYGYRNNNHFFKAIQKYGWNNIEHKIITYGLHKWQAINLERSCIKAYGTTDPKRGYNIMPGGEIAGDMLSKGHRARNENHPFAKKVVLINNNEVFNCIKFAATKYNITSEAISDNCRGKMYYAGKDSDNKPLVWQYYEEWIVDPKNYYIELNKSKRSKPVICINTGEIFFNAIEAAKKYSINSEAIRRCCGNNRKEKTAGYCPKTGEHLVWQNYIEWLENPKEIINEQNIKGRSIICIETGKIYMSISLASKTTGICYKNIRRSCNGERKTAGGFHWAYYNKFLENPESYNLNKLSKNNNIKRVMCITTGKIYNSIKEAAKDTNANYSCISKACKGKIKTAGKLKWKYIN